MFDQKPPTDTGGPSFTLPNYESKVVAPRNPTLNRGPKIEPKVREIITNRNQSIDHFRFQFTPSTFLKEMSLDTQQKLLNTREMYLPKIIALSDMAETSLQTVRYSLLNLSTFKFDSVDN